MVSFLPTNQPNKLTCLGLLHGSQSTDQNLALISHPHSLVPFHLWFSWLPWQLSSASSDQQTQSPGIKIIMIIQWFYIFDKQNTLRTRLALCLHITNELIFIQLKALSRATTFQPDLMFCQQHSRNWWFVQSMLLITQGTKTGWIGNTLRGYISNQKLACFVLYLKIINTLLKHDKYTSNSK